ncbi:filamentous hemagglutinin N-terminal domain-containing protein [Proteus vulgaris]|nr:filamentous hemagglutinin N-terminal domain-containing protein [Proteus vulgaris]
MCEKDISWKQRLISYIIAYIIAIYPLHPAWSLAITPSDKTIKVNQQNTVPIINISTPNNLGISHNKFHSFNVSKQGVVLNNATTSVNTQLAKQVNANTHLKGSAAHLIINEVVGNGRSQLQGKLEVAGEQAKVVIANPNGITCDGCSFINTPAITLTTGKPLFNPQGAYSAIEVKKGGVVIGTQGIDLQTQDYADIISRSIELNGKINAKTLSLMQGNNRIDFDKGTVNSINGEGVKPTLSIDTKVLGGMYANQIRLVSTEKGVGVNLSNIQTNQNSVNLTVDGKITFNGNIQSDQDINVSSKELQINSNTKLKAKRDITLATNTLINHSEVISEKDMRLFADKLTNKNEKALIQAKDNLWIQRNAQGDPNTLIENQSATIKTEKGDLIIRTKKLVNESITPLFKEIKQEPDSKLSINIGNHLLLPSRSPTDDFLLVIAFPELKNFSYKKWFDILDLKNNGGVNVERSYFEKSNKYVPSIISSGNNLYIQSNDFINNQSRIIADNNLIATGSSARLYYYRSAYLNKWEHYSNDNAHLYYRDDIIKYKLDEAKFNKVSHFVPFVKTGSHYEFSVNDVSDYIIKAGNNLVLDFKNSIDLERKLPFTEKEIKKFRGLSDFENTILAKNILLNANNVNVSLNLTANDSLSIIADKSININNSKLLADENISLTAIDTIKFENIDVTAKYFSAITKKGNVSHLFNPTTFYTLKGIKSPYVDIPEKIYFNSGKNIDISNVIINKSNELNLSALEDIKINRDESFLFNLVPFIRDSGYIPAFLINMGVLESNNITFTSGKDIISQGIKYHSDKEITFNAGQDIFLASKSIKEADPFFSDIYYLQLQSKLFSDDNLILNAARDVDLSSTVLNSKDKVIVLAGRNIKLGANAYSAIKDPHEDAQDIQYSTAAIIGNKGISIASSGALITEGSSFKSDGDITISCGGNIQLGSVKTHFRKESGSKLEEIHKQVSTEINSGNNLTLLSEGSILFQASKFTANKEIDIAAKGGFLYAQAMEESSYYEEEKKKCNRWTLCTTKKKYTKKRNNTNNKVTEFIANGDINLFAKDDITLEASKLETAKNAKLTSKIGKVNFKAVKNTAFKQVITNSKDIYITQRNQGYIKESWALPTLYIGGKLTIDAPKGISADIKAQKGQSLEQALTVLSNTPEYAWLKELQHHQNVNWNLVKDTYSDWDDKTKQLNPVVGAVIAIAVGVATYGTATAATIGGMASKATIAAGASASVASTASVAAQAGFASLVSQATVSLAENQGNISKTLESLGRSDTVKSVVTSMVVAGALQGLDQFMGWDQAIQGGTLPSTGKLLATDSATWNQVAQRVASHSVVSSTLGTAIQGGSFIDNFKTALLSNIGSQLHAEGANLIGDNGAVLGHAGKVLSHSIVAGISAEIAGDSVTGAVAGALAAEIAAISLQSKLFEPSYLNETDRQVALIQEALQGNEGKTQLTKLIGALTGAIVTRKPEGVFSAANSAELVYRHNYSEHMFSNLALENNKDMIAASKGDVAAAERVVNRQNAGMVAIAFGLGGSASFIAGHTVIAATPELITIAQVAFNTCKANWVYCTNQLGINIAGISAPEAAIAGVTFGSGYKVLASSEESAKAFSSMLANSSKSLITSGKLNITAIKPIVEQEKLLIAANKKVIEIINNGELITYSGVTTNGYKVSNGAKTVVSKNELEYPIVQSRINIDNGNLKRGWVHVIHRHFSDKNASQFTISQVDLKLILQSNDISKIKISRIINSKDEKLYERVIILDKYIGIDKFTKNSTNIITILTDNLGNLVTVTPGRLK